MSRSTLFSMHGKFCISMLDSPATSCYRELASWLSLRRQQLSELRRGRASAAWPFVCHLHSILLPFLLEVAPANCRGAREWPWFLSGLYDRITPPSEFKLEVDHTFPNCLGLGGGGWADRTEGGKEKERLREVFMRTKERKKEGTKRKNESESFSGHLLAPRDCCALVHSHGRNLICLDESWYRYLSNFFVKVGRSC